MPDDARTLALLESIEGRLARLEERLALADSIEPAIATVTDVADSVAQRLQEGGVDIDQRLRGALDLLERLSRPDTMQTLSQALDLLEQGPSAVATVTDVADGVVRRVQGTGVDVDRRARAALGLLERATRPDTMQTLQQALDLAEQAPAVIATVTDIVDSLGARLGDAGVDLDARLRNLVAAADYLSRPALLEMLEFADARGPSLLATTTTLLDSGVFDEAPVETIGDAATSLATVETHNLPSIGLFGLLGALRDPDVARTLSFAREFARRFGSRLRARA